MAKRRNHHRVKYWIALRSTASALKDHVQTETYETDDAQDPVLLAKAYVELLNAERKPGDPIMSIQKVTIQNGTDVRVVDDVENYGTEVDLETELGQ